MTWRPATPDDPALRPFADATRHRGRPDPVIVEGVLAVARAIEAGWAVETIVATAAAAERLPTPPSSARACLAEASWLKSLTGFDFHRGCLAAVRRPVAVDLVSRVRGWLAEAGSPVVLVLDAVADPVNVGAALRNARAFGVAGVVVAAGADPLSPRAVRASVGHVFAQPWCTAASVDEVLAGIVPGSVPIWAATVDADAVDVATLPAGPGVLLVGSEGPGLSAAARARADVRVTVPLAPGVDSLNAAAAVAVLLYALRARGAGQPA